MAIKFGRPLERKIGFVPVEQEAREATDSAPLDLAIRMRRNRRAEWARRMPSTFGGVWGGFSGARLQNDRSPTLRRARSNTPSQFQSSAFKSS